jgi:hypothetical protein
MNCDGPRLPARVLHDLDRALQDQEETEVAVAFGKKHLAGSHRAGMTSRFQRGDVTLTENWKGDVLIVGHELLQGESGLRQSSGKC